MFIKFPGVLRAGGLGVAMLCMTLPSSAAGLLELYRDAVDNDAQFATAKAEREAADALVTQSRGQLLPQIGASGSNVNNNQVVTTDYKGRQYSQRYEFTAVNASINLSQAIFRPQLWAAYAQSLAQVRQAEGAFLQAKQELILRVAQAYFDILLAEDTLQLAREQKAAISEQLKQANRYFEAGVGTITDINEAQARFDTILAQEIAAENNLEVKMRTMEQLIGKWNPYFERLGAVPLDLPEPLNFDRWLEFAKDNNPVIKSKEAALDVAHQEVYKSVAGHLPTVDLVASHSYGKDPGYTTINTDNRNNAIGIQVSIPLFASGATQGKVNQSAAMRRRAQADLESAIRATTLSARQEYLNVVNGVAQVKALQQAVKSNELALYSAKKGLEAGVRTSFDVLNAQQLLFSTKRDLAQERYRYVLSRFRLRAAAGLLDDADVQFVQGYLAGPAVSQADSVN